MGCTKHLACDPLGAPGNKISRNIMVCVPEVGPFTHYGHYHPTARWEDCTEELSSEAPNCDQRTSASPLVLTTCLRDLWMRGQSRQGCIKSGIADETSEMVNVSPPRH